MITTIIFGVLFIIGVVFAIVYISLYHNMKKKYNTANKKYNDLKEEYLFTGRKGFYVHSYISVDANVIVQEIERYNGYSKIRLVDIEIFNDGSSFSSDGVKWCKENVQKTFTSIRKTSDIQWLELNVKDSRKAKIKEIEKNNS